MNKSNTFISNDVVLKDCEYILNHLNFKKLKKSKILILGGNSFIASYLQAILVLLKCEITSISLNNPKGLLKSILDKNRIKFLKMDLTNKKKVDKILKKKFSFIFHCATYGQPKKWKGNEDKTVKLNIDLLRQVLDHSVRYKSKVLYLSSAAVYKIPNKYSKIEETSDLEVGKFPGEIIYANSKIMGEQLCKIYRKKYKLPIYIARPAHTYGPGQDFKDPRYIPQILKRAMVEKKIYIFNKAKSVRTWGYIADIIIMLLNIVQYGKSLTYNVSGTNHKSFYEVTKIISKIFNGMPIKVRNKKMNFVNPKTTILKISSRKYFKEFKKKHQTSLIDGLKKTIDWNKKWQKLN